MTISNDEQKPPRNGNGPLPADDATLRTILEHFRICIDTEPSDSTRLTLARSLLAIGPRATTIAEDVLIGYLQHAREEVSHSAIAVLDRCCHVLTPMYRALDVALTHRKAIVRLRAIEMVPRVRFFPPSPSVQMVTSLLRSDDVVQVRKACATISQLGPQAVHLTSDLLAALETSWCPYPSFYSHLEDSDEYRDRFYQRHLETRARINPRIEGALRAIGPLALGYLTSKHGSTVTQFERLCGIIGAPAFAVLEAIGGHPDVKLRVLYVATLLRLASHASLDVEAHVSLLVDAIGCDNPIVRANAARGLTAAGPNFLPTLFPVIRDLIQGDACPKVRMAAISSLLEIDHTAVASIIPTLLSLIANQTSDIVRDATSIVAKVAMQSEAVFAALVRTQGQAGDASDLAAVALGLVRPQGENVLLKALSSTNFNQRKWAAAGLKDLSLQNGEGVATLLRALDDSQPSIQYHIAPIFRNSPYLAFPILMPRTRSADPSIALAAVALLIDIVRSLASENPKYREMRFVHECMRSAHPILREAATPGLVRAGYAPEHPLVQLLAALDDQHRDVRLAALVTAATVRRAAIRRLNTVDHRHDLTRAFTTIARLIGNDDKAVRAAAVKVLNKYWPPVSQLSESLNEQLKECHKELYLFLLTGEILLESHEGLSFKKLPNVLWEQYKYEVSDTTLRNTFTYIERLFRAYRNEPEKQFEDREHRLTSVDEEYDFFDRRNGKPLRLLRKGWESWGEVKLYFALLEGRINIVTTTAKNYLT